MIKNIPTYPFPENTEVEDTLNIPRIGEKRFFSELPSAKDIKNIKLNDSEESNEVLSKLDSLVDEAEEQKAEAFFEGMIEALGGNVDIHYMKETWPEKWVYLISPREYTMKQKVAYFMDNTYREIDAYAFSKLKSMFYPHYKKEDLESLINEIKIEKENYKLQLNLKNEKTIKPKIL